MPNLGARLRADGLPAGQAEQPEDSPQLVLPAGQKREQSSVSQEGHTAWMQHLSGTTLQNCTSTLDQQQGLLTMCDFLTQRVCTILAHNSHTHKKETSASYQEFTHSGFVFSITDHIKIKRPRSI